MTDWPKHLEACANCSGTSSLYAYGGHGYCTRCYRLIRHIQIAQAWNRSDRDTLRRIGKRGTIDLATGKSLGLSTDTLTDEQFENYRTEVIRQLNERLALYHSREQIRRLEVPVTPLMLEEKFVQLLRLVRPRADYPRNANYLDDHFNEMQLRVIFALLEGIIEQQPWRGIDEGRLWRCVYSRRKEAAH